MYKDTARININSHVSPAWIKTSICKHVTSLTTGHKTNNMKIMMLVHENVALKNRSSNLVSHNNAISQKYYVNFKHKTN